MLLREEDLLMYIKMRKIIGIVLCLLMVFAVCIPAFAQGEPVECMPDEDGMITIDDGGN